MERLATNRESNEAEVREAVLANGQIDSLEGLELILAAEEEYGIDVPLDALTPDLCRSLSELAALIRSKLDD